MLSISPIKAQEWHSKGVRKATDRALERLQNAFTGELKGLRTVGDNLCNTFERHSTDVEMPATYIRRTPERRLKGPLNAYNRHAKDFRNTWEMHLKGLCRAYEQHLNGVEKAIWGANHEPKQ